MKLIAIIHYLINKMMMGIFKLKMVMRIVREELVIM
jgi:hypothetical protein